MFRLLSLSRPDLWRDTGRFPFLNVRQKMGITPYAPKTPGEGWSGITASIIQQKEEPRDYENEK